jgi:hypothetical protein
MTKAPATFTPLAPPPCVIVSLAAYRAALPEHRATICKPAFEASGWPDNDFHRLGSLLAFLADAVRVKGAPDPGALAELMESYSVTAYAACKNVRAMETRVRKQEKARAARKANKRKALTSNTCA